MKRIIAYVASIDYEAFIIFGSLGLVGVASLIGIFLLVWK
jgi:hypothetical protein